MAKSTTGYTPEFRRQMVELHRTGRSFDELAKEFGCTSWSIRQWVKHVRLVAMRSFVGIDLGVDGAPAETTVCKFRHLLERNKLGKVLLTPVNDHLQRTGIKITKAPSSTPLSSRTEFHEEQDCERDPEMHQTAKASSGTSG